MKIEVQVKTGSKNPHIESCEDGKYKVYLSKRPIKGEANQELIKVLSDFFHISPSLIEIKKGQKTSVKIIELN